MRREFADGTICNEESLARQSEKDGADINKIMSRMEQSGIIPLSRREGEYLDVSEVGDFRQAREQVRIAEEYFFSLPAESRGIFSNDPAEFLDAVNDPSRLQDLVDAGVIPEGEVSVPSAAEAAGRNADGTFKSKVAPEGGAVAPEGGTA